jgi:hypothetical protein
MCIDRRNVEYIQNFGRTLGKGRLERPRMRWEDNSKIDLADIGSENGRYMEVAQDYVIWRAFVLMMLSLRVLLLECWLVP